MADRDVRVRLSAQVANYIAGMQAAAAATDRVTASGLNLSKLGGQLQSFGRVATLGLTAPLAAAGVAAVGTANKFNTSFVRMTTLAGVSATEIGKVRTAVLGLSGQTGRGPQELADALYAASSSGLDTRQSLDAVTIAAKGAAAGLGSTKDIISLVASATASYGEANMDAATATDILVGTIREGRADPQELAGTLGRILPVAANLGVSFEEVGGSVAFLSNVMGDTNRTVTSMSGILNKLQSPTDQAREALNQYGSSMENLQRIISEDGLLGAMQHLQAIGLSDDPLAFRAIFDDVEARQGALAMIDNLAALEESINGVSNSSGALEAAFNAAKGTPGFEMAQAWAEIQVALIEFGDAIGPIAADVATAVGDIASAFASLPDGVQMAIAGVLIAVGPLAMVAGTIMKHAQTIAAARTLMMGVGIPGLSGPLLGAVLGVEVGSRVSGQSRGEFMGDVGQGAVRLANILGADDVAWLANQLSGGDVTGRLMPTPGGTITPTLPPGYIGPPAPGQTVSGPVFGPPSPSDWLGAPGRSYQAQFAAQLEAQREAENAARIARNRQQIGGQTPYSRDLTFVNDINEIVRAGFEAAEAINQAKAAAEEYTRVASSSDWGAARFNAANTAMRDFTSESFGLVNLAMASEEAFDRLGAAVEKNGFTLDVATEAGRENMVALQGVASVLDTQFVSAYDSANGSLDAFMKTATTIGDQTLARLQSELGLTDEQTAALADTLNLTATDYEARFELSGTEEARQRLGLLSGVIGLLQEDVQREVAMKIATGDFNGALKLVQSNIAKTPSEKSVTIRAVDEASGTIGKIAGALFGLKSKTVTVTTNYATSGVKTKSSQGRYVPAGSWMMSTLGEEGPEVVLPLDKPGRMQQLLGDARVFAPIAAALGGASGGGGGGSGFNGIAGGASINLVVNAGLGTDGYRVGQQIVDALAKYTRVNGPGAMQRLAS